jgi:putative endonuclease
MSHGPYFVYILASLSRRLYTGVTSNLPGRTWQHREHVDPRSHTARYRITRLVYYEAHADIRVAIAREKQIKSWRREKKIRLIESINAGWLDLGLDLVTSDAPEVPRRRRCAPLARDDEQGSKRAGASTASSGRRRQGVQRIQSGPPDS